MYAINWDTPEHLIELITTSHEIEYSALIGSGFPRPLCLNTIAIGTLFILFTAISTCTEHVYMFTELMSILLPIKGYFCIN